MYSSSASTAPLVYRPKELSPNELARVGLDPSQPEFRGLFAQIQNIFNGTLPHAQHPTILELYGAQDAALEKISNGRDRTTECWVDSTRTVHSLLVYKHALQTEFIPYGALGPYLEIKTLFQNKAASGNPGVGKLLIERAEAVARASLASGIGVTVSNGAQEALRFFKSKGFQVIRLLQDPYKVGNDENVLFKDLWSAFSKLSKVDAEARDRILQQADRQPSFANNHEIEWLKSATGTPTSMFGYDKALTNRYNRTHHTKQKCVAVTYLKVDDSDAAHIASRIQVIAKSWQNARGVVIGSAAWNSLSNVAKERFIEAGFSERSAGGRWPVAYFKTSAGPSVEWQPRS